MAEMDRVGKGNYQISPYESERRIRRYQGMSVLELRKHYTEALDKKDKETVELCEEGARRAGMWRLAPLRPRLHS